MKILLNKQEMESMNLFVANNLKTYLNTYAIFDEEGANEVLAMPFGEIASEVVEDIPWFNVESIDEEGAYTCNIDSKLFSLYMETLNSSMQILSPYTDMMVQNTKENKDSLLALSGKFEAVSKLFSNNIFKKAVGFVSDLLGIKDYVFGMLEIGDKLSKDEEIGAKLEEATSEYGAYLYELTMKNRYTPEQLAKMEASKRELEELEAKLRALKED